jgi:hypothetical protein
MNACSHCWSRYMDAMALSRQTSNPTTRKTLIRHAYTWLHRYFDAEDRAVMGRSRLTGG